MPYIGLKKEKQTSIMSSKAAKFRAPDDYAFAPSKPQASTAQSAAFTPPSVDTSVNSTYTVMKELMGAYAAGDTERQNAISDLYMKGVTDPKAPWYNPYVNATANTYYDEMRNMGIGVPATGVPTNILNEWKSFSDYSNVDANNVPLKPSKTSTVYQDMAYYLYKLDNIEADTQRAESEWAGLQAEIGHWVGRGYNDNEVLSRIEWDNYPTLQKMDEGRQAYTPLPLTRAVGYSPDALYGVIWQARNPEFEGDIYSAIGNYANGWGKQYQPDPNSEAAGVAGTEYYNPYYKGTTLGYNEYAKYLPKGETSFSREWLSENANNKDIPDDVKKKVRVSLDKADKATGELNRLREDVEYWLDRGKSVDSIFATLSFMSDKRGEYYIMDKDEDGNDSYFKDEYPTLYEMEYKRNVGGAEELAYSVDFALPYFKQWVQNEYAKRQNAKAEATQKLEQDAKVMLSGDMDDSLAVAYKGSLEDATAVTNAQVMSGALTADSRSNNNDPAYSFMAQYYASMEGLTEQEATTKQANLTYDLGKFLNGTPLAELGTDAQQFAAEYAFLFDKANYGLHDYDEVNGIGNTGTLGNKFSIALGKGTQQEKKNHVYGDGRDIGITAGAALGKAEDALENGDITSTEFAGCVLSVATAYETARLRDIPLDDLLKNNTSEYESVVKGIYGTIAKGKERKANEKDAMRTRFATSYYDALNKFNSGAEIDEDEMKALAVVNSYNVNNENIEYAHALQYEDKVLTGIIYDINNLLEESGGIQQKDIPRNMRQELTKQTASGGGLEVHIKQKALEPYLRDYKLAQYLELSMEELYEKFPERNALITEEGIAKSLQDAKDFYLLPYGEDGNTKSRFLQGDFSQFPVLVQATEESADTVRLNDKNMFYAIGRGVESGAVSHAVSWANTYDYWILQRSENALKDSMVKRYDREGYRAEIEKGIAGMADPQAKAETQKRLDEYDGDIYNFGFDPDRQGTLDWIYGRNQYLNSIADDVYKHCSDSEYRAFEISSSVTNTTMYMAEALILNKSMGFVTGGMLPAGVNSFLSTTFTMGATSGAEMGNALQAQGMSLDETRKYAMGMAALTGALETLSFSQFTGGSSIFGKLDDLSSWCGNTAASMMSKAPKVANKLTVWAAKKVGQGLGTYVEEGLEEAAESVASQVIFNTANNRFTGADNALVSWDEVFSAGTDGGEVGVIMGILFAPVKSGGTFFQTRDMINKYAQNDALTVTQANEIIKAVNDDLADPELRGAIEKYIGQSEVDARTTELMAEERATIVPEDIRNALDDAQAKKVETQAALDAAHEKQVRLESAAKKFEELYKQAEAELGEDGTTPSPEAVRNAEEYIKEWTRVKDELTAAETELAKAESADTAAKQNLEKAQKAETDVANTVLDTYRKRAQKDIWDKVGAQRAEKIKQDAEGLVRKTRAEMEAELETLVQSGKMTSVDADYIKKRIQKRSDKLLQTEYNMGKSGLKQSFELKMQGWTLNFADIKEYGEIDVDPDKKTITIDDKLSYAEAYMKVASHEFTHLLKSENSKVWDKYANIVLSSLYGKKYQDSKEYKHDLQLTIDKYTQRGMNAEKAKENAQEELVAHLTETIVFGDDLVALQQLVNFDRSLGKRMFGWLLDKLTASGDGTVSSAEAYAKIAKARRVLEKGLRQVSKDTKKSGARPASMDATDSAVVPTESSATAPTESSADAMRITPETPVETAADGTEADSTVASADGYFDPPTSEATETTEQPEAVAETEQTAQAYEAKRVKASKMSSIRLNKNDGNLTTENGDVITSKDVAELDDDTISIINDDGGINVHATRTFKNMFVENSPLHKLIHEAYNKGIEVTFRNITASKVNTIEAFLKKAGLLNANVRGVVKAEDNALAKGRRWLEVEVIPKDAQEFIDALIDDRVDRINTSLLNLSQFAYDKASGAWQRIKDGLGEEARKIDAYIIANDMHDRFTFKTQKGRGSNTADEALIRNYRSNDMTANYWEYITSERAKARGDVPTETQPITDNSGAVVNEKPQEQAFDDGVVESVDANAENVSANANTADHSGAKVTTTPEEVAFDDSKRYSLRDPSDDLMFRNMLNLARSSADTGLYTRLIADHVSAFSKRLVDRAVYSYEIHTPFAIAAELARKLGANFDVMRMPDKNTLAVFDKHSKTIATSSTGTSDLSMTMHALGERLQQMTGLSKPDGAPDTFNFGLEFFKYMTRDDRYIDPDYRTWLETALRDNELYDAVRTAKSRIAQYENASAAQKVMEHIRDMNEGGRSKWRDYFKNYVYNMRDQTAAAQKIDNIIGGTQLRQAAAYLPYGKRMADRLLHMAFVMPDGTVDTTRMSMSDAIESSGLKSSDENYKALRAYMLAVHALDRAKAKKPVFGADINTAELQQMITNTPDDVKRAADALWKWWNDFMQVWMVDTGRLTADQWSRMKKKYTHYVPTYRKFEGLQSVVLHEAKGSDLPVIDPIAVMQTKVQAIVEAVQQNRLGLALHNMYENAGDKTAGLGLFVQRIEAPMEAYDVKQSVTNLLDGTGAEPKDIDDISAALEKVLANNYTGTTVGSDVLKVTLPDGNIAHYKIHDKPLYDLLSGMSAKSSNAALDAIGRITRLMASLTTGSNMIFMTKNVIRDFQKSVNYGSWASNYVSGTVKWIMSFVDILKSEAGELLGKDWTSDDYRDYQALGGGEYERLNLNNRAGMVDARENIMRKYRWHSGARNKARAVGSIAFNTITLSKLNQMTETASRYAEYKFGEHDKDTAAGRQEAFMAAQEATVDFQRTGASGIAAFHRRVIPFWNATAQGTHQTVRMFTGNERARLKPRLAKTIFNNMLMGALSAGLIGAYGTDEEKENYCMMDDTLRASNILLPNSWLDGLLGDGIVKNTWARIPLQQDALAKAAYLLGQNVASGLVDAPDGFAIDVWEAARAIIGDSYQTGSIADPLIQVIANDAYYGGKIISDRLAKSHWTQRGNENVGEFWFELARVMDAVGLGGELLGNIATPAGLKYIFSQYGGVIGQIWNKMDGGNAWEGLKDAFYTAYTTDATTATDIDDDYYKRKEMLGYIIQAGKNGEPANMLKAGLSKEELTQAYELANAMNKSGGLFKNADERIAELYDEIREIEQSDYADKDKEQLIKDKRNEILRTERDTLMQSQEYFDKYMFNSSFGGFANKIFNGNEVITPMTAFEKLDERFQNEADMPYMVEAQSMAEMNPTRTTMLPNAKYSFDVDGSPIEVREDYRDEFDERYYDAYTKAAERLVDSDKYGKLRTAEANAQEAVDADPDDELAQAALDKARKKRADAWADAHSDAQRAAKEWYLKQLRAGLD